MTAVRTPSTFRSRDAEAASVFASPSISSAGTEHAAGDDGAEQPRQLGAGNPEGGGRLVAAPGPQVPCQQQRAQAQAAAQVEQAGEKQRRDVAGQELGERRTGAEEQGGCQGGGGGADVTCPNVKHARCQPSLRRAGAKPSLRAKAKGYCNGYRIDEILAT